MTAKLSRFVSIVTAAKYSGLSTRHFRRRYCKDKNKVFYVGQKLFLLREDLERWVEQMRKTA